MALKNVEIQVKNFNNVATTSGYATPLWPFTFIPVGINTDPELSNKRVIWDFGDGTQSTSVTGTHYYEQPGFYEVTLTVFDKEGNAFQSSFPVGEPTPPDNNNRLKIINFIDDYINFVPLSATSANTVNLTSGKLADPFLITRNNSYQTYPQLSATGYSIIMHASGAEGKHIELDEFNNDPYGHLEALFRFVTVETNNLGIKEIIPADSVTTNNTEIYAAQSSALNDLIIVPKGTNGSMMIGTTGKKVVYFVSDYPQERDVNIFASLDLRKFASEDNTATPNRDGLFDFAEYPINQVHAGDADMLAVSSIIFNPADHLSITSNGIDSEGFVINTSFDISENKFVGTKISFVIKLKDIDNFTTKNYPLLSSTTLPLTAYNLDIGLVTSAGKPANAQFFSDQKALTGLDNPQGVYKGYFITRNHTETVRLTANVTVQDPGTLARTVTGESNYFKLYKYCNPYGIEKKNENVSFEDLYKSFVLTEHNAEHNEYLENFLGQIVGDLSDTPNTLGKRIYEKIANYASNIVDNDTCNVNALISLLQEFAIEYKDVNYAFPPDLRRLVDLISIKQTKLWGQNNMFQENFDKKDQFNNSPVFGVNRGPELDLATTVLTANSASLPIVAYERFGEKYTLQNTFLLNGQVTFTDPIKKTYPLSAYDQAWGWGLVLAPSVTGLNISKFYRFFEYVPGIEGSQYEGVINWNRSSLDQRLSGTEDWTREGGIAENLLSQQLYRGLDLFTSAAPVLKELCTPTPSMVTRTPTPTPTPTPTATPTVTPSQTVTPSITPTQTVTPSITQTSTPPPTPSVTPTNTPTQTVTPTNTPTNTPSNTPPPTPSNTPTLTPSNTPTRTPTPTPTLTPTPTTEPPLFSEGYGAVFWDNRRDRFVAAPGKRTGTSGVARLIDASDGTVISSVGLDHIGSGSFHVAGPGAYIPSLDQYWIPVIDDNASSRPGTVHIIDATTFQVVSSISNNSIMGRSPFRISYLPAKDHVAIGSRAGEVWIFKAAEFGIADDYGEVHNETFPAINASAATSITYDPDNQTLICAIRRLANIADFHILSAGATPDDPYTDLGQFTFVDGGVGGSAYYPSMRKAGQCGAPYHGASPHVCRLGMLDTTTVTEISTYDVLNDISHNQHIYQSAVDRFDNWIYSSDRTTDQLIIFPLSSESLSIHFQGETWANPTIPFNTGVACSTASDTIIHTGGNGTAGFRLYNATPNPTNVTVLTSVTGV